MKSATPTAELVAVRTSLRIEAMLAMAKRHGSDRSTVYREFAGSGSAANYRTQRPRPWPMRQRLSPRYRSSPRRCPVCQ